MAFGVSRKVSHDISSAFGKGLHGLKVEAMANEKKPKGDLKLKGKEEGSRRLTGRAILETFMLGIFTIMVAAVPLIVTRVPAPESVIRVKEILQDWCTPSICFVVLIVGVMVATSEALGGSGKGATSKQNNKFTESYLIQRPVSAAPMVPLRMPDIFFSPETTRHTHALSHPATFPVRGTQPTSVMVPVYYPGLLPPQPSLPFPHKSEKDVEADRFIPRYESRFETNLEDRFVPRVDGRMPRMEERFSPRMEERFSPRMEERFSPRVEERFGPRVEERFGPRVEERFGPRVEERFGPRVEERFGPRVEERFSPREEERFGPRVEERYEPQEQDIFEAEEEDSFQAEEEDSFQAEEEDSVEPEEEARFDAYVETHRFAHDNDEARSEFEDESVYEHVEEGGESDREDEVESYREDVESEADDEGELEPEADNRFDSEDEDSHFEADVHTLPTQSIERTEVSRPLSSTVPAAAKVTPVPPQSFPSQGQSYISNATVTRDVEVPLSLLSRRRPPTVPSPVIVQKASEPAPVVMSEPVTTPAALNSPLESKIAVHVQQRKDASETNRPSGLSPPTPPEHARRPLSSSSSRSYAEFVSKRTSKFSPRAPLVPPRPPPSSLVSAPRAPSPPKTSKPDAVGISPKVAFSPKTVTATEVVQLKSDESNPSPVKSSRGSSHLMRQQSVPTRRPREVRVVDNDHLEDKDQSQDPREEDDVDQRVEAFLKNFREQMRLQRQESLQRHRRGKSPEP